MADGSRDHLPERDTPYLQQLVADTLERLSPSAKGPFLKEFLKALAGVEVSEQDGPNHWEGILARQFEMRQRLGRAVSLVTAASDYFDTAEIYRSPALIEYQDLKRLRRDAATDGLTGLYNRRLFDETVTKELNRAQRASSELTLLLFDMRDFKGMNDTYGHAQGDRLLGCFARAVTETIRRSDYGFRIGGDEFAVLLPESDSQNARTLARRIEESFQRHSRAVTPNLVAQLDYGLASFPAHGETREKLYEVADQGLYAYKNSRKTACAEPAVQIPNPPAVSEVRAASAPDGEPIRIIRPPDPAEGPKQKRRHIRLSMEGVDARGILHDGEINDKEVRLLDLARGGIGFLLDDSATLPEHFFARLHVPPFRDVDLRFRRVYMRPQTTGLLRVGASIAV